MWAEYLGQTFVKLEMDLVEYQATLGMQEPKKFKIRTP